MTLDGHVHLALDGGDWRAALERHRRGPDREYLRRTLADYARRGVTWLRDGGDNLGVSLAAASLREDTGVTVLSPAFPLYKKGRYGSFLGRSWDTLDGAKALIREAREAGADFIKLFCTGICSFTEYGKITSAPLTREETAALVAEAHTQGLPVMAHVSGARAVQDAAEAGADSLEHGYYADKDALLAMVRAGTVWLPTLAPVAAELHGGRYPDDVISRLLAEHANAIGVYVSLGGLLACGSDAGAAGVPHGEGVRREETLLESLLGKNHAERVLSRGHEVLRQRFRPR